MAIKSNYKAFWNLATLESGRHQRWADIDFSTPDPYPKKFSISISNPYPKISEI